MRINHVVTSIIILIFLSGCYVGISGHVIDAETQQPIEGAVVLVEWTKTKGYGFTYTESYKVAEVMSDKDGNVKLPGCLCLFTNEPDVTVYKRGYVAWNNKFIFPDYAKRKDFTWQYGNLYQMNKFKPSYSFIKHQSFIDLVASLSSESKKKENFMKAYEEWEEGEAIKERRKK